MYTVKSVNDQKYLYDQNDHQIVALEDVWDKCWEIHIKVGHQGRQSMEKNNIYSNITRPIIEIFLKYSEKYQEKLKRKKKFQSSS